MIKKKYEEIDRDVLKSIYGSAWSIENMAGHGAEGRRTEYIGSVRDGNRITDYYKDSEGSYWYGNRGIRNGEIVEMDVYIFGHKVREKRAVEYDHWEEVEECKKLQDQSK